MGVSGAIILSTGRCGSTALDRALCRHPDLRIVPELLEPALPNAILAEEPEVDGAAFLKMLDRPTMEGRRRVWREQGPTAEALDLPAAAPWSLFHVYTLPALVQSLPGLSFGAICREVTSWPTAPPRAHLRRLFTWLTELDGRKVFVERTGGSSFVAEELLAALPDARIVHLVRHGVDVALSMERHPIFQAILAQVRGGRPPFPPEAFARFWAEGARRVLARLDRLPAAHVFTAYYEALCGPHRIKTLSEVAAHLAGRSVPSTVDRDWATLVAPTLRLSQRRDIDSATLATIYRAAKRGLLALGYEIGTSTHVAAG